MFRDGEQKVLNKLPESIDDLKKDLGLLEKNNVSTETIFQELETQGQGESKSMQRVLSLPGVVVPRQEEVVSDNSRFFTNDNYGDSNLNQSASSFVIIVTAVIALIALVAIVTLSILKYIGI